MNTIENIEKAKRYLRGETKIKPKIGIILGTGLGPLAERIKNKISIPYKKIPFFPETTMEGHSGNLILGEIGRKLVVAMQGRFHLYEGYSMAQITFPVRVMKALGIKILIESNIAGGMNPDYKPGDLVLITDQINLMGGSPLIGPNDEHLGPRFPDMSQPYDLKLAEWAEKVALEEKIPLKKGVYVGVSGPNLETKAEYRFLRGIGADLVGMSTVPEVIVAVHSGLRVLGISVVSDSCLPDALKPANIKELLKVSAAAEPKLTHLVEQVIKKND